MKRDTAVILIVRNRGFTLAEIAIGVLILGIMLSMGLKTAVSNLENAAYAETRSKQEQIKLALIGFLRTNGRLPCPDNAAGLATGVEPAACVGVLTGYGVLPWQALGISRDTVLDGWGNFFSYRVSNVIIAGAPLAPSAPPLHANNNQIWTIHGGVGGFDIRSFISTITVAGFQSILIQNRDTGAGLITESRNAVVVLVSHGKNGLGAKTTKAAARIAGAANDEATNATLGSTTFVRRAYNDNAPVASGGPYDDVVTYMTPQDLLQPLITERTLLGTCPAYCTGGGPAPCVTTVAIPIGAPLTPAVGLACP
ncbi:MAG: proteinral secretion pathway protein H [Rhodocyclaceae bacterium]|nr:MAG: proteinral secretion pathway protein H [Rhodocyclaceae bacterium]TNC98011.1 MAG: proteinral secretion pathway protein H [Rhodocyclaceae bacterium]